MKLAPSKLNEVSSRLINKHHDQWCRDNGYRIRSKVGQYGHRCGRNVSKKRQQISTPKVSAGCRQGVASVELFMKIVPFCRSLVVLEQILRHLRYPCDTLATGGVSKLLFKYTNGYRSFLGICDTSQLFLIF